MNNAVKQKQRVKVDTAASKEALRLARNAYNMGSETARELQLQAEKLDNIENRVDNIHAKLDKVDEYIECIKSLPAYIGYSLRKDQRIRRIERVKHDRSVYYNIILFTLDTCR